MPAGQSGPQGRLLLVAGRVDPSQRVLLLLQPLHPTVDLSLQLMSRQRLLWFCGICEPGKLLLLLLAILGLVEPQAKNTERH